MINYQQILGYARSRTGMLVIVGALVVLNIGRLATDKYQDHLQAIDSKHALLGQYRISTANIEELRNRITKLEAAKNQFESHLFTGNSRKEISSAMQIRIQEVLDRSGLNPESLRPITKSSKNEELQYGEIVIKIRLTGKLDNLLQFFSGLYKMKYLFKIDNFTLKPFKKTDLKVFLELKGFYRLKENSQKKQTNEAKRNR